MNNDIEMVKPKIDVVFKKMFADKNNKALLIDLIASLLDIDKDSVKDVEVKNPEIAPESIDDKFSRLDILLETREKVIDIEMQTSDRSDFIEKILIYWAKTCAQDVEKGEKYGALRQNISISILDFNHKKFDHEDYYSSYMLYDIGHDNLLLTDKCAFLFFELHKMKNLDKDISGFTQKELWLKLINADNWEDLDMLKKLNNPIINDAIDVVESMNGDPAVREIVRQRYFAQLERNSLMAEGKKIGREEGIGIGREEGIGIGMEKGIGIGLVQGRDKEREQTIAKMRAKGFTEEQIMDFYSDWS